MGQRKKSKHIHPIGDLESMQALQYRAELLFARDDGEGGDATDGDHNTCPRW